MSVIAPSFGKYKLKRPQLLHLKVLKNAEVVESYMKNPQQITWLYLCCIYPHFKLDPSFYLEKKKKICYIKNDMKSIPYEDGVK